jgi:hypothetical protein
MALKDSKMFDLGYGNLLAGIQRGQDKADRARERAEDREFTREQKKQDQDFSKSERIEGQDFTKKEAELNRTQETSVVSQRGNIQKDLQTMQTDADKELTAMRGNIDIKKINTQNGWTKYITDLKQNFMAKESGLDRTQKEELFNKQIAASETEWRAKLNTTENLASEANQLTRDMKSMDFDMFREKILSSEKINNTTLEAQKIMNNDRLSSAQKLSAIENTTRLAISQSQIEAEATNLATKIASQKDLSEQETQQRIQIEKEKVNQQIDLLTRTMSLQQAHETVKKQQVADNSYSFQKSPYQSIFEESKAGGFNETDVLDEYFGYGEGESAKAPVYGALSMEVTKALETSPGNAQRQELLGTLIRLQDRFSDPEFYDYGSQAAGESNKAQGALQDIQGLITRLGYNNRVKPLVKEQFEGLNQGDLGASSFLYNTGSNIGSGLYNMVTDTPNERPMNIPDNVTY